SGRAMVNCPACYDGVTAVGGTSFKSPLLDASGNLIAVSDETAWNDPPGVRFGCDAKPIIPNTLTGASGGGISTRVAMPDYQVNAAGFSGGVPIGTGRVVPDVSLLSFDPPIVIVFKGQVTGGAGTSVSSPLWAGLMALINQFKGSQQGSPNPELYRLGTAQ